MLGKNIYLTISRYTILIVGGLISVNIIFLIFSVGKHLIEILFEKLRKQEKNRYLDLFYSYILDQLSIYDLKREIKNKNIATEAMATAISQIKGSSREKLKKASLELSITGVIEKYTSSLRVSRRLYGCYLLGLLGTEKSAEVLIKRLYDRNSNVVSAAIIAIGEIGSIKYLKFLLKRYKNASLTHSWLISSVISRFSISEVYSEIEKLISSNSLPSKKIIFLIRALESIQFRESLELLVNLYKNTVDIDVKIASLSALGSINEISSVKIIFESLQHERWEIRAVACKLIGEMGLKGASYRLLPLLRDKNWYVRKNAAYALVKLGKIGIHTLLSFLETNDRYARDIIVHTLEESGIIEDSIMVITGQKSGVPTEAMEILKTLVRKGYTKYLLNYSNLNEIQSLLKGATIA